MKLSDIKGERTIDVIADLIDPVINIAQDPAAAAMFKDRKVPDGMEPTAFVLAKIRANVPTLLRTHKDDLILILATIGGVTVEEYAKSMALASLIGDLYGLLTDEEFLAFFN